MRIDLEPLGLTKKEAAIYLALIGLGPSPISSIMERAGLNRTTGYDIVNGLIAKGLVRETAKRGKKMFIAEPPDRLVRFAERHVQEWQRRSVIAHTFVPVLSALHRTTEGRPLIRYFEGIEGLKEIYEDSLRAKDVIRAYSSVEEMKTLMYRYAERYFRRRTERKIFIRAITKESFYARQLKRVQGKFYRELRLVPADKFDFTLERYIYNNKVAYMSFRDRFGVIIESQDIAHTEKYIFELAWQAAKKYDAEIERKLKSGKGERAPDGFAIMI